MKNLANRTNSSFWLILLALAIAAGLKFVLVATGRVPFNADEAIIALMGKHILAGERPVFFYGQAYMGSLDAYLVAGAFAVFGHKVWVIRFVQAMLYLGTLITTAILGRKIFNSWELGAFAALLLSIPAINLTLYTTASLGGYGEALLIGNLIILVGLRIIRYLYVDHVTGPLRLWVLLGFLSGLGLWAFGITLVYSMPVGLFLVVGLFFNTRRPLTSPLKQDVSGDIAEEEKTDSSAPRFDLGRVGAALGIAIAGIILGSLPLWVFAATRGVGQIVGELGGGAIQGVEGAPWLVQVWAHFVNFLLLGVTVVLGMRPPWEVTWLAFPLLPFVLVFWMAVFVQVIRLLGDARNDRPAIWLLLSVMLTLSLAFILTPFGADPSGRYFTPLAIPLSLFAASLILSTRQRVGKWAYGLAVFLLVYHLWGTIQVAVKMPPGITTQFYEPAQVDHRYMDELIAFLEENGERYGYSNYWISYPLAFLSDEELIYIPRLPYHPDFRYTERDDRYQPYDQIVDGADTVAYITSNHPDLDTYLREHFSELGISWREHAIGDYLVFYHLSGAVRPADIGLGITTTGLGTE